MNRRDFSVGRAGVRLKSRFIIAPLSRGRLPRLPEMARPAKLPWDVTLPPPAPSESAAAGNV